MIRWEQWQWRFWSASCERNWFRASKLVISQQDELHRVGVDHEDQAAGEEPLGAIKPGDVTLQEDRMALDAITSAVLQEMLASLAVKVTPVEAWEVVRSLRIGSEVVWNARAQRLRTEFKSIRFKEGETVDDFTMRLSSLSANSALSGR
jgi:hypothetical protein